MEMDTKKDLKLLRDMLISHKEFKHNENSDSFLFNSPYEEGDFINIFFFSNNAYVTVKWFYTEMKTYIETLEELKAIYLLCGIDWCENK